MTCRSQLFDDAVLFDRVSEDIELILEEFDIKATLAGHRYLMSCPVHNGDNKTAVNLYHGGIPIWKCRTRGCHEKFGKSIFGFIRGILSLRSNSLVTHAEARRWLVKFFNLSAEEMLVSRSRTEKKRFVQNVDFFNRTRPSQPWTLDRKSFRERLKIPAAYYLNRGFDKQILDNFDVGLCVTRGKQLFGHTVVPIYEDSAKYVVGAVARSPYEKCVVCGSFHGGDCPRDEKRCFFPKWKGTKGFNASWHLYNAWNAAETIRKTGVAVLVEGQSDVWRAVSAGIDNAVGMFGDTLNDEQLFWLETSGALSLVVLTDNDTAGRLAAERIRQKCGRLYRLYFPSFNAKDLDELNVENITKEVKPFIDRVLKLQ